MDNNSNNFSNDETSFDFKEEFFRLLFFWKYFVFSISFFLIIAFLVNRYTPKVFDTNAKIQILDKKQNNLEMPTAEDLFSNSKINLENEIEIIKSSTILKQVIDNLDLNIFVEEVGEIITSQVLDYPFTITSLVANDSIKNSSYNLVLEENGLIVTNLINDDEYLFNKFSTIGVRHNLPFEITRIKKEEFLDKSYNLNLISTFKLINIFKNSIAVSRIGKSSDIINLNYENQNIRFSQKVLNEIINVFNKDGIRDRQLIHKRTIDFVNERYIYLSSELDSIEVNKKKFKIKNNLVNLSANSEISLQKSLKSNESLFDNENQIFIVSNLIDALSQLEYDLLPSNIGVENIEINSLIVAYNEAILEQRKFKISAGPNNPSVIQLDNLIKDTRSNILFSLNNYLSQLNALKVQLTINSNRIENNVADLPSYEKSLRSIERNQQIKEALYLFLLQKGEEAQVSFAVTEPSIKVIEYARSDLEAISPKTLFIYLLFLLIGFFIPLIFFVAQSYFDNKIHTRLDLEKFSLNVLAEIPFFDLAETEKVFTDPDDRSIISESFRMLMSNVRYLQKNDSESNVILVTSSIKGEGKTLNALNLALSFSSVGKKVLLIGCDLRNPQLHKYIDYNKNVPGLVDYLVDNKTEWKKNILNPFNRQSLDILLSGPLPPNPLNLINNGNIDILLKDARKTYDYIIIDSAPTLLVADTKSLINKSDILIFLTRCNVTDNDVLSHIKKVSEESDTNVGVILNGVGSQNSYGYSYAYGYNYKYSYNYGYGYGYNEE